MQSYAVTLRLKSTRLANARLRLRRRTVRALLLGLCVVMLAMQAALASISFIQDQSAGKTRLEFARAPISQDKPVLLAADSVEYDRTTSTVVALGHVEVSQEQTVMLADRLSYNQSTEIVVASGNVSVLEPSGHVYFADNVELNRTMSRGVIKNFRARLADNSLFAANEADQIDREHTQMKQAVYSPCSVECSGGGTKTPLWQLRAKDVVYDKLKQRVIYHNAYFELYGLPVMYTPYLSHAAPGADNTSGLLFPEYAHSTNLGSVLRVPVYYAIAPDRDVIITPIFTSEEGVVMATDYRQRFDEGFLKFTGSITNPSNRDASGVRIPGNQVRWHIDGGADFQPQDHIRWGAAVRRASDDTYLRRYDFSYETQLTSRLYWENTRPLMQLGGRSSALVEGLAFQGLTAQDITRQSPVALPLADFRWESATDARGARWDVDANLLNLMRQQGTESRRLSLTGGWTLPHITPDGHVFSLSAHMRGDFYSVDDVPLSSGATVNGETARFVPEVAAQWRYPLINRFEQSSLLVEPVVQLVATPNLGNDDKIPNEDSRVPEFSDANLFSTNRFPGYDRVENGARANYGLRGQYDWQGRTQLNALFGQSYRGTNDRRFPLSNDLSSHVSDYVGSLGVTTKPLELAYRFRMDNEYFSLKRSEWIATFDRRPLTISASYLKLDSDPILGSKEELAGVLSVNLTKNWTASAMARRDMELDQLTFSGFGLSYANECVTISATAQRDFIRDRDVKPDTSIFVRFSLKNLN